MWCIRAALSSNTTKVIDLFARITLMASMGFLFLALARIHLPLTFLKNIHSQHISHEVQNGTKNIQAITQCHHINNIGNHKTWTKRKSTSPMRIAYMHGSFSCLELILCRNSTSSRQPIELQYFSLISSIPFEWMWKWDVWCLPFQSDLYYQFILYRFRWKKKEKQIKWARKRRESDSNKIKKREKE